MKLILSRRAFDSGAAKVANPILDDGSMIPVPIPDKLSPIRYDEITVAGENLGTVAFDLTRGKARSDHFADLDPDRRHHGRVEHAEDPGGVRAVAGMLL